MHRRPEVEDDRPYVPPRAMLIVLGTWMAVLFFLALVVVPILFAQCVPNLPEQ